MYPLLLISLNLKLFDLKIGILSDTHSHFDDRIAHHLSDCDEIWHAGDLGDVKLIDTLNNIAATIGVYGNIDSHEVRAEWPKQQSFIRENLKIVMTHIAGYPGTYNSFAKQLIKDHKPDIFITGHSHICKVVKNPKNGHIHINPGAAGVHGFHKMRTLITLHLNKGQISKMQLIELGLRAKL